MEACKFIAIFILILVEVHIANLAVVEVKYGGRKILVPLNRPVHVRRITNDKLADLKLAIPSLVELVSNVRSRPLPPPRPRPPPASPYATHQYTAPKYYDADVQTSKYYAEQHPSNSSYPVHNPPHAAQTHYSAQELWKETHYLPAYKSKHFSPKPNFINNSLVEPYDIIDLQLRRNNNSTTVNSNNDISESQSLNLRHVEQNSKKHNNTMRFLNFSSNEAKYFVPKDESHKRIPSESIAQGSTVYSYTEQDTTPHPVPATTSNTEADLSQNIMTSLLTSKLKGLARSLTLHPTSTTKDDTAISHLTPNLEQHLKLSRPEMVTSATAETFVNQGTISHSLQNKETTTHAPDEATKIQVAQRTTVADVQETMTNVPSKCTDAYALQIATVADLQETTTNTADIQELTRDAYDGDAIDTHEAPTTAVANVQKTTTTVPDEATNTHAAPIITGIDVQEKTTTGPYKAADIHAALTTTEKTTTAPDKATDTHAAQTTTVADVQETTINVPSKITDAYAPQTTTVAYVQETTIIVANVQEITTNAPNESTESTDAGQTTTVADLQERTTNSPDEARDAQTMGSHGRTKVIISTARNTVQSSTTRPSLPPRNRTATSDSVAVVRKVVRRPCTGRRGEKGARRRRRRRRRSTTPGPGPPETTELLLNMNTRRASK